MTQTEPVALGFCMTSLINFNLHSTSHNLQQLSTDLEKINNAGAVLENSALQYKTELSQVQEALSHLGPISQHAAALGKTLGSIVLSLRMKHQAISTQQVIIEKISKQQTQCLQEYVIPKAARSMIQSRKEMFRNSKFNTNLATVIALPEEGHSTQITRAIDASPHIAREVARYKQEIKFAQNELKQKFEMYITNKRAHKLANIENRPNVLKAVIDAKSNVQAAKVRVDSLQVEFDQFLYQQNKEIVSERNIIF